MLTNPVVLIVFVSVALLEVAWLTKTYNALQKNLVICSDAHGNLLAALSARYATILGMLKTTSQYMQLEKEVQEKTAALRSGAAMNTDEANKAVVAVEEQVKTLIANLESNPQLASADLVSKVMESLRETEDNVAGTRLQYNRAVAHYLTMYNSLPNKYLAKGLGFIVPKFFSAEIAHPHIE